MPSSSSKVVHKQLSKPMGKSAKPHRRENPALRVRSAPSPLIADGVTSDADLCKWADCFGRFHTDPSELYVPVALRTVDCLVTVQRSEPTQAPRRLRCVREIAKFNGVEGVEWKLMTWVPGLPGVQFQCCASEDEAMILLESPPETVTF